MVVLAVSTVWALEVPAPVPVIPTTAPTAVTAVAEATAIPRTETRLTQIPSAVVRRLTAADVPHPLVAGLPFVLVTGGSGPARPERRALRSGGVRRRAVQFAWSYGEFSPVCAPDNGAHQAVRGVLQVNERAAGQPAKAISARVSNVTAA
ncbi:hypothetical protein GCM10023205_29170 [Yinghuangia aomiensis]|uniref:Secreted protein n=1 Tax=Yinghuangia aomiensis TaxID=676205 RepID=A0ABP9H856_9ACTN